MLVAVAPAAFATDFSATFNIGGQFSATYTSTDSSTWHPGAIGEQTTFTGQGGFSGIMTATTGDYGSTFSTINACSNPGGGAQFTFSDYQNFDVLSANWDTHVEGYFQAGASGSDAQMNLKSVGSMYCWSEATEPYWNPELQGGYICKEVSTTQNGAPLADLGFQLWSSTGTATLSNGNIWGFGTDAYGTSTTNYGGGPQSLSAGGSGQYTQGGFGNNYFDFNGFVMPAGGSMNLQGQFANGFNGIYSMTGN